MTEVDADESVAVQAAIVSEAQLFCARRGFPKGLLPLLAHQLADAEVRL